MQFNFITETATNRSLPQDAEFWNQLFGEAVRWGLEVYEQDWQRGRALPSEGAELWITETAWAARASDPDPKPKPEP